VLRKAGTLNKKLNVKGTDYIVRMRSRSYNIMEGKQLFAV